ncbi:hypothetical protein CV093_10250 [Oceanobacillus sp. 143]|uniref:Uncharacterized protein n=1 Tax=Oceanobacillus zhaokaii TaxID=2052660 RepID=A0A345PGQ4_9BACI|nr:hypothetical protein [Oceanobacillus zhaokaii]AXI09184.1 hypothetical protein CUC15_09700 [Oceanobacillus zhaokaii]QGS68719.1 hypothetical protein CV093_10250 [Oceanobacillus sp. 143]
MSRRFDNHLTGIGDWKDWIDYEEYGESEWSKKGCWYKAYLDTPSKEECDRISAELSGEVVVYKIK